MKLAGGTLPKDRVIDGVDLSLVDARQRALTETTFFYYRDEESLCNSLQRVEVASIKLAQVTANRNQRPAHSCINLGHDPGEQFDLAKQHPEVIAELMKLIVEHQKGMKPGPPQLEEQIK